ncbi:MAG: protein-L-isoaspartate(D-aspartate) O-methyltransferase, partial [Calditrichota bacterium]
HLFVNAQDREEAYQDRPLFIAAGQTISQPYIVALMTQTLGLTGEEKVLEIGTGSGYQTAILAELALEVYTIERIPELSERARQLFKSLKHQNVHFKIGDGSQGWAEESPFDRIIITAAAPKAPPTLLAQLRIGGRWGAPIGGRLAQELTLIIKKASGETQVINRGGCVFVPLIGQEGWSGD